MEVYFPLVRDTTAEDKTLVKVAKKHVGFKRQVLIQSCLQKGWVLLPKIGRADILQGERLQLLS